MKILVFFLFAASCLQAQIAPFVDFNGYFRTFYQGNFRQLEFQRIQSFTAGDNLVAYIDNRGDFRLFDGENVETLTNQNVSFKLSDAQLAWNIGPGLFALDHGQKRLLTTFGNNYFVSDSLVVFEDTRFNTMNVLYNGEIIQLYQSVDSLRMPDFVGEDIVVFRDNGELYKIFWQGDIYEIGVWTMTGITFHAGTGAVAFNDPTHRTFTVFEHGEFTDVEQMFVKSYKAGRGFAVYEDLNGNLFHYANGVKTQLSNFSASFWDVRDDMVVWGENSLVYAYADGKKTQVTNYVPKDWKIKNGVFAFRNIMGGVSAFVGGKIYEITNQPDAEYSIYGNMVLVGLFNKSYIVLLEGDQYKA